MGMGPRLRDLVADRLANIGDLTLEGQQTIIDLADRITDELQNAAADPYVDLWALTDARLALLATEELIEGLKLARRSRAAAIGIVIDAVKFGLSFA